MGQFLIGKLVIIESLEEEDWRMIEGFVKKAGKNLNEVTFKTLLASKNILLIVQIVNLEQFITSPIEMPKNRKDWVAFEE